MKTSFFFLALYSFSLSLPAFAKGLQKTDQHKFVFGIYSNVKRRPKLFELGDQKGILVYRFDYKSKIDSVRKQISPVWRKENNRWRKFSFGPLPDVIYDYDFIGKQPRQIREMALTKKLQLEKDLHIPFIMSFEAQQFVRDKMAFGDLMQFFHVPHPKTLRYSPETMISFLQTAKKIYLKPIYGAQSKGIIVVSTQGDSYEITYEDPENKQEGVQTHLRNIPSQKELIRFVTKIMNSLGYSPYLVQEGIDYFAYQDKKTFYRLLTQRGKNGVLSVSGGIASLAGGSAKGGEEMNYKDLTHLWEKGLYPKSRERIQRELREVALTTHERVEEQMNIQGRIGEMGIDLVVDQGGRVFVLEANSKPGYTFFNRDKDRKLLNEKQSHDATKLENKRESMILEFAEHLLTR